MSNEISTENGFGEIFKSFFSKIYSKFFKNDNKLEQLIFSTLLVFISIIIVNLIYFCCLSWNCSTEQMAVQKITTSSLLILTFFIIGAIVGVLFGFPKQDQDKAKIKGEISGYIRNNNIDLLADWLSKILFGATVAQFTNLWNFVDNLTKSYYDKDQNFGLVILGLFFLIGLIYGFYVAFHIIHEHFQDAYQEDIKEYEKSKTLAIQKSSVMHLKREENMLNVFEDNINRLNIDNKEVRQSLIESIDKHKNLLKKVSSKIKPKIEGWEDDTWLGEFENIESKNKAKLDVNCVINKIQNYLFKISLKFQLSFKIDSQSNLDFLDGKYMTVFLHPSFEPFREYLILTKKENYLEANLEFFSVESFTLGVLILLENNDTLKFEYNLENVLNKPKGFM